MCVSSLWRLLREWLGGWIGVKGPETRLLGSFVGIRDELWPARISSCDNAAIEARADALSGGAAIQPKSSSY